MTHAQRTRRRRRGSGGPRNKALLALMVLGICVVLAGLGGVGYIVSVAASAPPLSSLKPRVTGDNTRVFAADGKPLGFIQADDLRLPMRSEEIPQLVKDATIAIEDERFYKHKGVDYEGVVRAAIKNLAARETVQGGSTITMQLVRTLYISQRAHVHAQDPRGQARRGARGRALEGVDPREVPRHDPVRHGRRPVRDRRQGRGEDLLLQEPQGAHAARGRAAGRPAAGAVELLADHARKDAAKRRRNQVLRKMAELGMVTEEQAERGDAAATSASSAREFFTRRREEYFFDYVKDELFREYGAADRAPGRHEGLHDDRPRQAGAGARHDRRPPRRRRARRRRSSRSTRATATSRRWPRRATTASRTSTSPPRATASPARRSR